jgi:2-(1,2-epoxy-1,2-dihydrophenyl)acetyl-CoA isomerase
MDTVLSRFDAATGIGRLTLNRPAALNAIDVPMAQAFLAAVRGLTAEPGLRVVLLTGVGRAFAAGGDVAAFAENGIDRAGEVINALLDPLNAAILALRDAPAPVICAVHGAAAGAGLSLALMGDLVIAASDARFVVAYDRLGTSPDCGLTWFLPRRVGRGMAMRLLLDGATLDADQALACGLADLTAPAEGLAAAAEALALRIAAGPTLALGAVKRLMDGTMTLPEHLEAERAAFVAATGTADFAEGVTAFLNRRKPAFTGR